MESYELLTGPEMNWPADYVKADPIVDRKRVIEEQYKDGTLGEILSGLSNLDDTLVRITLFSDGSGKVMDFGDNVLFRFATIAQLRKWLSER